MTSFPQRAAAILPMDSFAVVMATGIVSVAAFNDGYPLISYTLIGIAVVVFVALVVLVALRLSHHRQVLAGSLHDPSQVFGFYTFVAACDVLDARLDRSPFSLVLGLGCAALLAWVLLVPVLWRAMRAQPVCALRGQARGSWLLAVVGTQSLVITAVELAMRAAPARPLLGVALAWWVLGVAGYIAITALIVWRMLAEPLRPADVTPDSWVLMGALAISTLAAGKLLTATRDLGVFPWLHGTLAPAALVIWAVGSAWIPLLLIAEGWRARRLPDAWAYHRTRWATVFPLGMYASANYALAAALPGFPALDTVSRVFFWAALVAWALTAYGLVRLGRRKLKAA